MTQQDKIKLLKAGFTVIRRSSRYNERGGLFAKITKCTPDQTNWHIHDDYPSLAAMNRAAEELLKSDRVIQE